MGGKNDVTVLLINTSISFPEGVTYTGYLALCAAHSYTQPFSKLTNENYYNYIPIKDLNVT